MPCHLIDGPLMTAPERREAMTERMAIILSAHQVYADRAASVHVLRAEGFPMIDVHLMVDDARQVAMQEVVAREMMEP
jgi:hypothetical protein